MKKYISIFAFALFALSIQAQVTYRIDPISGGGFYLVEIVPAKAGDPAATPTEYPQRFNDQAQFNLYVENLRKQAKDLTEQAKRAAEMAPRIDAAATKIEAVGKEFFTPKPVPPVVTPPKPKKKKTQ